MVALRSADDDVEQFDATLEHLVAQRLLTRSAIESEADSQVDIAHEALINGWQQLQQWLKERRQAELTRRQLETKVAHWEGLNRAGGLLDAVELSEAENWLNSPDAKELGYSEELLTLLQASRAAIETAQRKLRNRFVFAVVVAAIAILSAVTATVYYEEAKQERNNAKVSEQRAEEEKDKALNAEEKAKNAALIAQRERDNAKASEKRANEEKNIALRTQSLFLADLARQETEEGNATNGILIALEALPKDMSAPKRPYVSEAEVQLYSAVFNHRERLFIEEYGLSFSPDGQRILTVSSDNTVQVLDAKNGLLLAVLQGLEGYQEPYGDDVINASFSANNQRIVTFNDNSACLWNTNSGQLLSVLESELKEEVDGANFVTHATFSPDGKQVVITSGTEQAVDVSVRDNNARLWDVSSGKLLSVWGHTDWINHAAFSPDGQQIVTASLDNNARLWDVSSSKL